MMHDVGLLEQLVPEIERRIRFAGEIADARKKSTDAWTVVRAEILADSRMEGLDLAPQIGLVPLQRDPKSRLQEFVLVGSGAVPE